MWKETMCFLRSWQRVTAPGCSTVTVHNRLCFGQCSSLFVPPEAELAASTFAAAAAPILRHRAPCSRCAPSKARTVLVPLHCGGGRIQQKRALVVEECKCETSREERSAEELLWARTHSRLFGGVQFFSYLYTHQFFGFEVIIDFSCLIVVFCSVGFESEFVIQREMLLWF